MISHRYERFRHAARRWLRRLVNFALIPLCVAPIAAVAQDLETPARHALLLDVTSGAVLMEKEADVPMPPASMSKLMTSYMV